MKTIFEILPVNAEPHKCTLLFEVSKEGFSYAIKDEDENKFLGVAVFNFEKNDAKDNAQFLHGELQKRPVLAGNFKKVYVMYSSEESVLVPFSLYSSIENANVLNLIHGNLQNNNYILTDLIAEQGIYNVYRMPESIINVVKSRFPGGVAIHQSSVLLNMMPAESDKLLIIFYPKKLVMMLRQQGAPKFINTFFYTTPQDISYILLNACKQFGVENIPVEISGLVEENSSLHKEIYKYFNSVSFTTLSPNCNYSEEITNHPPHYFSHIFAVDKCE